MGDQVNDGHEDRVVQIAKEQMAKFEAEDKLASEKKEETKGASAESSTGTEKTKVEPSKESEDANKDDASDTAKEVKEGPKDERIKEKVEKRKDELQKEIDSLVAKREGLKEDVGKLDAANDKIKMLEERLNKLEQPIKEKESKATIEETFNGKVEAYIEEDKEKPFNERREMSEEDLEEFFAEDHVKAVQWVSKRDIRRDKEMSQLESRLDAKPAEEFLAKQAESRNKLLAAYPKVDVSERGKQLIAQGKTQEEALEILKAENKEFALMLEIAKSDPKYVSSINGPELVMEEMNKRLNKTTKSEKKSYTPEEVEQKVKEAAEMERRRLSGIDEGAASTTTKQSSTSNANVKGYSEEGLKAFLTAGKREGWTEKDYIEILERRNKIPNASVR